MKYKVVKNYKDAPKDPIQIKKNEELIIIKKSDPNGDWPNWLLCKGIGKEGWIPKQIISVKGAEGIASEDYTARELNISVGEILISKRELNGWIWGANEKKPEDLGWAPLNCLQVIGQNK